MPQAETFPTGQTVPTYPSTPGGSAPQSDRSPLRLSWLHPAGLAALSFVNLALKFVTLGLYGFWAKTEIRRKLWSSVRLEGEPLNYTGTGRELFLGFLVIFGLVMLPILFFNVGLMLAFGPEAAQLGNLILYPIIFFLIGIGTYRAQRYRLTRTSWRGIRGALVGSDTHYALTYIWTALLIPMTLGWIIPWRTTQLQKILTEDTRFGDRPLTFTAEAGPLYKPFAVMWIVTALSGIAVFAYLSGSLADFAELGKLGQQPEPADQYRIFMLVGRLYAALFVVYLIYYLLSAWYRAQTTNHYAANTHFEGATFASTVTGTGFVRLAIGNFFITMVGFLLGLLLFFAIATMFGFMAGAPSVDPTAPPSIFQQIAGLLGILILVASTGLFAPIVQARSWRYLIENLKLNGTVPLGQIAQAAEQKMSRGEGLAQAFDIDGF